MLMCLSHPHFFKEKEVCGMPVVSTFEQRMVFGQ